MPNLNKSLNESLQAKYPHLELAILPLSQVNKDNESKRIDSEYFKKEYLENEQIITSQTKIKDFLESRIKNIKTLNLNKNFAYLQISDIDTNNGLEYTTTETDFTQIPDRATYVLQNNDICISTVRPNRNAVALIKDSKRLVGTSGFCVLRLKEKSEILPEVLYIFCKTKFFITKMMRANTASLYPAVIDGDVFKCQIPQFSQDFQREIQKLVQDSHKALEDSKLLYKEAERLLYESLGLDSNNPLASLQNDTHPLAPSAREGEQTPCHLKRSEVSKTKNMDLVDSSIARSLKNDREKSPLPCGGDLGVGQNNKNIDCHEVALKSATSRNDEKADSSILSEKSWLCGCERGNKTNESIDEANDKFPDLSPKDESAYATKYPHLNLSIRPLSQSYDISGRLDSEYYQAKYDAIERKIKDYKGGYCKLQDLGFFTNGSFISENFYTQHAKRAYIRIKELSFNEPIRTQECIYIDDNFEATNETMVKQNDFVVATIGNTIGKINLIPKELGGSFISNNTSRFRLTDKTIIPEFLELLLRNFIVQEQIQREFTQTAQPKISNASLENILIPKIDTTTQEQIACKIQKSFALRKESKDLLQSAKAKVQNAIENQ